MAKFKFSRKSKRNPDRIRAQDIHPIAYQSIDAFASLDDEIENDAIRTAGNQPFENPAYYDSIYD